MNGRPPDFDALGAEAETVLELRRRIADLARENERLRLTAERTEVAGDLIEVSPVPIVAFDPEGVVTVWNPAAAALFGWDPREAVGTRLPIVPADRQVEFEEIRQRALRGEFFTEPELHWRKADGSPVVVSASTGPLRRSDGTIYGIFVLFADVTDRKAADESSNRLSMAVEQASERIVVTDARGIMQYVNAAFERVTGYGRMELLGRGPEALRSEVHDPEFYREMRETVGRGEVWRGTLVNRRKDGTLYAEDAVISPVRDRSGRIAHYVGVSRDPATAGRPEESPAAADASGGNLTGSLVHDFNNLLTAISGYCDLLLHRVPEHSELRQDVERIRTAGERAAELMRPLAVASRRLGSTADPQSRP
jgi:PAS domain S-box-containing protein